jgi:sRNA-binding regulator protein Hfq
MDTMERHGRARPPRRRGESISTPARLASSHRRSLSNGGVPKTNVAESKGKSARPPEQTFEEVKYLKHLIDHKIPVCVKLSDGEEVIGVIEYYDQRFIRITRAGMPNLFIFKHDIKYLFEATQA